MVYRVKRDLAICQPILDSHHNTPNFNTYEPQQPDSWAWISI